MPPTRPFITTYTTYALSLVASVALAGCGPTSIGYANPGHTDASVNALLDYDGDGVTVAQGDCNDHDPLTYPGAFEICENFIDNDCDGIVDNDCDNDHDGYSVVQKDCDDNEYAIGPGSFEDPTNKLDDNCNGVTDEPTPACHPRVPSDTAVAFAAALEICDPWLIEASFNASDAQSRLLLSKYGRFIMPRQGDSMVLLSTGLATKDDLAPGYVDPQPGTPFKNTDANPTFPTLYKNICGSNSFSDSPYVNDMSMLKVRLRVPNNAGALQFNLNFFSSEYPDFVGKQYNDKFIAYLDSKAYKGNISFSQDAKSGDQNPITVNSGFFQICNSSPICGNGGHTCLHDTRTDPGDLTDTGFDLNVPRVPGVREGGATGWLQSTWHVTPGEVVTLSFLIYDDGDRNYDSAVLLDNFRWLTDGANGVIVPQ